MHATVRGLVELTRPVNCVAAGSLTLIGAFVAGIGDEAVLTAVAVVTTAVAVGAGNAINDYFDREIDAINQPDRPIPRGAVSPRAALAFSSLLFAVAVALTLLLPIAAIAIAIINLLALVTYTNVFKGLPAFGNALVAYLVGSTFLFGGAAVGTLETPIVLGVLAAAATFTREVIKDVEDIEGDREEGLNTLPIAIGSDRALWVATGVLLVAVAISPLPYLLGTFGAAYLVVVLLADAIMIHACVEGFRRPTVAQRRFKYGTFLAALAFVVGRAAALI
nr:geranylgeranylglycerol-phosphate geranylgeranyltransferase [Halorubrum vacuolatum]